MNWSELCKTKCSMTEVINCTTVTLLTSNMLTSELYKCFPVAAGREPQQQDPWMVSGTGCWPPTDWLCDFHVERASYIKCEQWNHTLALPTATKQHVPDVQHCSVSIRVIPCSCCACIFWFKYCMFSVLYVYQHRCLCNIRSQLPWFLFPKIKSGHVCVKFEGTPSRCSWDL